MATINGYTAEHMKEIEDGTIVDASIVAGHLILVRFDGTQVDAGSVVGPQGLPGSPGSPGPAASFAGYKEPYLDMGNVSGAIVLDFSAYNNWRINPTAAVSISFSNLPAAGQSAPGSLIVANSAFAITWPVGTKFADGVAPTISGLSFISLLALSTVMHVGAAWVGVA